MDRGALDAAIALGIPHGGWCPRGRLAEDGPIAFRYQLIETDSAEYAVRTERNVLDSDATLILYRGAIRGGTELTQRLARRHGKPLLLVDLEGTPDVEAIRTWLIREGIRVLNVAGPRESSAAGIARQTKALMMEILLDEA